MRSKIFFLCLLLMSFLVGCSNKGSDQAANTTATNAQPAGSPAATSDAGNAPGAKPPLESERREKPTAEAVVIPAGTAITVRTENSLSSATSQSGDSFSATLADPIVVGSRDVVPAGAKADGTVAEAQAKGKIKGAASLRLELTSLTIRGTRYPIQTSMAGFAQKGKGKRTAVATGGGAALGALIGGIAGGGKGAAIGVLAGGGAGFAGGTLTGNKQIELPAETALTFKLKEAVTLK